MDSASYTGLVRRITRLRWQVPVLAFVLVLAHQIVEHTLLISLPRWQHFASQLLFYGLVGPALAWWALTSLRRSVRETEAADKALKQAHAELQEANRRLEFLIRVNRRLAEAEDDEALIQTILTLPLDVVPAAGCSLVRFDENQRPMLVIHHGNLTSEAFSAWENHLSASDASQVCIHCSTRTGSDPDTCPLILPINEIAPVARIYCLDLVRGRQKYGVLNLYLSNAAHPTPKEAAMLKAMADEMSLALESVHLRSRELSTLFQLQKAQKTRNLHKELGGVLNHIVESIEIEGGALYLTEPDSAELKLVHTSGQADEEGLELLKGLAGSAFQTEAPFIISDLAREGESAGKDMRSLLIAPLRTEENLLGSLILWAAQSNRFARRHIPLIGTVAGQTALLIENHRLYLLAEHQAALAERTRLAREIHDGLAQTLGYLQLRISRMQSAYTLGQMEKLKNSLDEIQDLVDEAYEDAREAIDGLRIQSNQDGLDRWIQDTLKNFQRETDIQVTATAIPKVDLPSAVQVQILRIVQEALENIRKHAACLQVSLTWTLDDPWLTLRIQDNGAGFDPDDVLIVSHHGLRIMRERAELLDADFQVISRVGEGTQIVLRLPVDDLAGEEAHG